MYRLEIYLDNGFDAKYRNLTIEQVLKEVGRYVGIEYVSIMKEELEVLK